MAQKEKNGLTKKTSVFENGLIWFGAGVSIAEILTGTYLAPLGMAKGVAAILLGHLIGCCNDVRRRTDRRADRKKRHGNRKNELWKEGRTSVFL